MLLLLLLLLSSELLSGHRRVSSRRYFRRRLKYLHVFANQIRYLMSLINKIKLNNNYYKVYNYLIFDHFSRITCDVVRMTLLCFLSVPVMIIRQLTAGV